MSSQGFKVGFERLGMVAFVAVAAIFGLIYLAAGESYVPPDPDSEKGRAIAAEIAGECEPQAVAILARLCREQVNARHRWRHYKDGLGAGRTTFVIVAAAVGAGVFGLWAVPWVYRGFRDE